MVNPVEDGTCNGSKLSEPQKRHGNITVSKNSIFFYFSRIAFFFFLRNLRQKTAMFYFLIIIIFWGTNNKYFTKGFRVLAPGPTRSTFPGRFHMVPLLLLLLLSSRSPHGNLPLPSPSGSSHGVPPLSLRGDLVSEQPGQRSVHTVNDFRARGRARVAVGNFQ